MPAHDYELVTTWELPGTPEEISDLLGDTDLLARIWPSLYAAVRIIEPGGEHGVGRVVQVVTRGHLPYVLRWTFRVTESRYPRGYSIDAWGDLVGHGRWSIEPTDAGSHASYVWRVRAEKRLLRWLSPILRPLFERNHARVMDDGERALRAELARRHNAAAGTA